MADRSKHQGTTEQDPPWPSMHPEDDYDGARVVEQDDPDEPGVPTDEDSRDPDDPDPYDPGTVGRPGPADETD